MTKAEIPKRVERGFEWVAKAIERQILKDGMSPGDELPSEIHLATQLGVHRSTLREALRSLEQNGLVTREVGRKKLRVNAPRAAEMSGRLASAMLLQRVTFGELYHAMYALEPACAQLAATARDEADLAALNDNLDRTRQALHDSASLTMLDIEFHRLVARAGRNRALELAREPLSSLFYPAFYAVMSRLNAAERLLFAHEHIVAAIAARDAATARRWMERHIADFRRGYERADLDMDMPVNPLDISSQLLPANEAGPGGGELSLVKPPRAKRYARRA